MKTIEVPDEIYEWMEHYKPKTPSWVIKWWHDEVFEERMSSLSDADFGR